jgi:multidrug resistance efflux pump
MKKFIVAGIVVLLLVVGGAFAFTMQRTASAQAAAPVAQEAETARGVVAEGVVVPAEWAALSSPTGGVVVELLARAGEQVSAGQTILRLESSRQQAAVAQAEAALSRAQARLAELQAGPRVEEIAVVQAAVGLAQAQLARAQQGAQPEEIAAAKAAVAAAQASLNKVLEGATPGALTAARTDVSNAQAALQVAQAAYDKIAGSPDVGASQQALNLQQATNAYNAAVARLSDLERGASKADVDAARARLAQAQAQLQAVQANVRPADVAVAEAQVKAAEEQLALAKAGARPEAVKAAEADVAAAQAALDQAQAALRDMEIKAPFAGTLAELNVRQGEQLGPAAPFAQLANLGNWQIETADLTELNVANIKVSDAVEITVDALPGAQMTGKVVRIGDVGMSNKGDISYKIVIAPEGETAGLKWNMTAAVTFENR